MKNKQGFYKTSCFPDAAILPGEYLAEEIEERGITQKELARRMKRPFNTINEIVNGKKPSLLRLRYNLKMFYQKYRPGSGLILKQITSLQRL